MEHMFIYVLAIIFSTATAGVAQIIETPIEADPVAAPSLGARQCNGPTDLKLDIGCVRGFTENEVDKWLGVPFASPPVGNLRFRAPKALSRATGIINATQPGNCCWGAIPPIFLKTAIPSSPFDPLGGPLSEDCLTMNIYRPHGVAGPLPIVVWPFSGGFRWGCANTWDFTSFVKRSVAIDKPVMVLAPNYRVNVFGFLCGPEVPLGDLNAGILDHFFAMDFIHASANALGGNKNKITVWGQSYGATMLEMEMLYLERQAVKATAGILDSCTGPVKTTITVQECTPRSWKSLLNLTNCSGATDKMACLRAIPEQALFNTTLVLPTILPGDAFPVIIDPRTQFDARPSIKIRSGDFKGLPLIMGRTAQDGTVFAATQRAVTPPPGQEDAVTHRFLTTTQLNNETWTEAFFTELDAHYPYPFNDTTYVGPFETGLPLFDRLSLIFTDAYFSSHMKLLMSANSAKGKSTYGYLFNQLVPPGGAPRELGVYHGSNLVYSFGLSSDPTYNTFAQTYQDYYINFINTENPGLNSWKKYTSSSRKVLQIQKDNTSMIADNIRQSQVDWLNTPAVQAIFEK